MNLFSRLWQADYVCQKVRLFVPKKLHICENDSKKSHHRLDENVIHVNDREIPTNRACVSCVQTSRTNLGNRHLRKNKIKSFSAFGC